MSPRLLPALRAAFGLAVAMSVRAARASAQDVVDLANPGGAPWHLVNRSPVLVADGGRPVLRFDERAGGGLAWSPALALADGDIEVEVLGRDVLQKSFVGIAFHVASDTAFEVVWLRPFNYESADSSRRAHSVQYASYPAFGWQVLRAEQPGGYEAAVPPGVKPTAWAHLRVELRGRRVSVYLNGAPTPVLAVEGRGGRSTGGVGLFVGDMSPGDFANLRITPASSR